MKRNTIIFLEGKEDVKKFNEKFSNKQVGKIISMDFHAHVELKLLKIPHSFGEEYIKKLDEEEIDKKTVFFTTNWYKELEGIFDLTIEGINLGNLVEIEIVNFYFLILKRVAILKRVLEKENPKKIIVFSLSKISQIFKNNNLEIIDFKKEFETSLYFDKIEIPIHFRNKTKTIKISRNTFLKLKHFSESVSIKMSNASFRNNNEGVLLLLDFNPSQYKEFFSQFSKKDKKIVLLNQRRPAIWNWESFQIIKNSNCKIVNLEDFQSKEILLKINTTQKIFNEKFLEYLKNDEKFISFFSFDEKLFWDSFKNEFASILLQRFNESIKRIYLIKNLFSVINIEKILEWAHTGAEEKIVLSFAKKLKIPSLNLQHAIYPVNSKWEEIHTLYPIFPDKENHGLIWGNSMKNFIVSKTNNEKNLSVVGSPKHDDFFNQKNNQKNDYVLLAGNILAHFSFTGNDTRSYIKLEEYVTGIIKFCQKRSKKLVIKLHPTQSYYDIKPLIKKLDSKIPIFQNQSLLNLIQDCDSMISLNYSTVLADAMILKKPTMVVLPEYMGFIDEEMIKQDATIQISSINKLDSALEGLFFDNEKRKNLIENANKFIDNNFSNQGRASKHLVDLLVDY